MSIADTPLQAATHRLISRNRGIHKGGFNDLLRRIDRMCDERFAAEHHGFLPTATKWEPSRKTLHLYQYEHSASLRSPKLDCIKTFAHDLYDCAEVYVELWTFGQDGEPLKRWDVRSEIR